ncbi:MAG: SpoIID/LytB domain-containing protein [Deltaproteobacteria bacterium]|nr:SpoIID/LytB domain-containing protein [Deltaproteobacteria bacterium]
MRLAVVLALMAISLPAWAEEQVRIAVAEDLASADISGSALELSPWTDEPSFTPLHRDLVHVGLKKGALTLDGKPAGEALRIQAHAGLLKVHGFAVRGTVDIKATPKGLLVVNAIPLEDYLAAVLGGEMPPVFPEEALKAQAVAARTYAIQRKLDAYGHAYHLGATVLSQVYGGAGREDARTRAAVQATAGQILTFDLAPIEAYFHASCGGKTESGKAALGRDLPYLRPVSCPCTEDPKTSWSLELPDRVVSKDFHVDADDLKVAVRSTTGRALALTDGAHRIDAVTFRRVLGYDKVKSLGFVIEHAGDKLELKGRGLGHGAGLCQIGAKVLAEKGWGYQRILEHYYPGAVIQRMY